MDEVLDKQAHPLIDFAFTKTAEHPRTGDLELKGYASTWAVDRDNEVVAPDAFKNLDQYLERNPILLWQHDQSKPIGQVKDASLDGSGLIVVSRMPRPEPEEERWAHTAYSKVQKGIVRTYSIGGKFRKLVERGKSVKKIVGCELYEISVVSVPANPESLFEAAVKSVVGPLRPDLHARAVSQMEQIVGMKSVSDPDLLEMTPAELTERYDELVDLYLDAGKRPPEMSGWRELAEKQAALTDPAEIVTLTPEITEQVRLVQGMIDAKYGRTFSKRNEEAILTAARGIVEHGNALVRLLAKDEEKDDDEDDEEPEKAKAEKPEPDDAEKDGRGKSADPFDEEPAELGTIHDVDTKRRRGYNPAQPRDPGGEGGGQWVRVPGASAGGAARALAKVKISREDPKSGEAERWGLTRGGVRLGEVVKKRNPVRGPQGYATSYATVWLAQPHVRGRGSRSQVFANKRDARAWLEENYDRLAAEHGARDGEREAGGPPSAPASAPARPERDLPGEPEDDRYFDPDASEVPQYRGEREERGGPPWSDLSSAGREQIVTTGAFAIEDLDIHADDFAESSDPDHKRTLQRMDRTLANFEETAKNAGAPEAYLNNLADVRDGISGGDYDDDPVRAGREATDAIKWGFPEVDDYLDRFGKIDRTRY